MSNSWSGAHLRAFTVRAGVGVEHVGTNVARAALKKNKERVFLSAPVCVQSISLFQLELMAL